VKNRTILIVLFLNLSVYLLAQDKPFPQNIDYSYGYQTTVIDTGHVRTLYQRFKDTLVEPCGNPRSHLLRVICHLENENETRSEGMGYGMILAAYFADQGVFDSLFAFYRYRRNEEALGLMAWSGTCQSIWDIGSATDGDIDVAYALLVAEDQWGGEGYIDSAKAILSILKTYYFLDTCGGGWVMQPGYSDWGVGFWGGCELTDLSYYPPAFFRVFYDATGDAFWLDVADDAYELLDSIAHPTTGLVPNWQSWNGVPGGDPPVRSGSYRYDASRVPWRLVMDYIWNGNSKAQAACEKISDFAYGIGPSNILDGYELDGTPHDSAEWNNGSFVGGFAVGGMAHSQEMVDSFAGRLAYLDAQYWDNQYYNLSLKLIYEVVLTGNFWKPELPSGIEEPKSQPGGLYLAQNYPNPFDEVTTIEYSISSAGFVRLAIYDIMGREVKKLVEESISAGEHTAHVNMQNLSSGVYIYRLEAEGNSIQKKMILLK
jgi:endo-1,4-beta-D-glucanase Y